MLYHRTRRAPQADEVESPWLAATIMAAFAPMFREWSTVELHGMMALGVGELVAVVALGVYALGDPDGRFPGALRRGLVMLHGLLVLAGAEWACRAAPAPEWVRLAAGFFNCLILVILSVAIVKSHPTKLSAMLQATFSPLVYAVLVGLARHTLAVRGEAVPFWAAVWEEVLFAGLVYFSASALTLVALSWEKRAEMLSTLGCLWVMLLLVWIAEDGWALVYFLRSTATSSRAGLVVVAIGLVLAIGHQLFLTRDRFTKGV